MEPTLKNGQIVWVNHWVYLFTKPKIGEVVVFENNGKNLIKRITATNHGCCYLSGDNEEDSFDSKNFGWVGRKKILGKVITKQN